MKNIYLAARYSRHPEMRLYAEQLEELGYVITSRWIKGDHEVRALGEAEAPKYGPIWAEEDWQDVMAADIVISFTEGPEDVPGRSRGGRHVEFGIAYKASKRCIIIGYRENVFHWLPNVIFFETWEETLQVLRG